MSDEGKKKSKVAWGAVTWGALGLLALTRAFWRGNRALMRDGYVASCAGGKDCSTEMTVDATEDAQAIYSPVSGVVVSADTNNVVIVPNNEAAVLQFSMSEAQVQVATGQRVGAGQQIGLARRIGFSVSRLNADASMTPYEPASWLAVHGMRVSGKFRFETKADEQWCETGRKLEVPSQVASCGMSIASPSGYALLPVNIEMR
jgi:hypothetical protein